MITDGIYITPARPVDVLVAPGPLTKGQVERLRAQIRIFGQTNLNGMLREQRRAEKACDLSLALMIAMAFLNALFLVGLFAIAWRGAA